jgi:hypothetical protein
MFISIKHYVPITHIQPKVFANCTGFYELDKTTVFQKYQRSLNYKWFVTDEIQPVVWTNRDKPVWAKPIEDTFQFSMHY